MIIQKAIKLAMDVFEQKVNDFAKSSDLSVLTATLAQEFSDILKESLSQAGRVAYQAFVESYDTDAPTLNIEGNVYRRKMASPKNFLTPFGTITMTRSLYQADRGGKTYCPLDDMWGMAGEYATEDVRQAVAYTMAHLTPNETEEIFKKAAWFHPSATAIKTIANRIGEFAETNLDSIMPVIQQEQPIAWSAQSFVVSMDGVNVLLREKGVSQGRPAERPGRKASSSDNTAYKNAMVGTLSCYANQAEQRPQRLQTRYIARMPQEKAVAFKAQLEQEVAAAEKQAPPGIVKIFLCDGQRSIWNYADNSSLFDSYEKAIDFYHTTEYLSKASEAIFGKCSDEGRTWYDKYRTKLLEQDNGPEAVLRSMLYYEQHYQLPKARHDQLERAVTFFSRNKQRMPYADFIRRGLPIGSGPVEGACKSIVKTRLCRSGMRWYRTNGQHILHLRCFVKSNRWDLFWKQYIQSKRNVA